MKRTAKKLLIVIFTLLITMLWAGCGTDTLGDYKKAAEKTDQINKGQTSGEFSLVMELNTDGLTAEEIKKLNYYKDMQGSFQATYDHDAENAVFRNYLNLGGLGFDFNLYLHGDEVFIKLPVVGKYMQLDEMITSVKDIEIDQKKAEEQCLISRETQNQLSALWLGLLKKDDVFKGKNIILTTPDGEVKTTEYTIKLSDEQIKTLANKSIGIISQDENLKESFNKYIKNNVVPLKDTSFEKLLTDLKQSIKDYQVETFTYTAYVDIDGYIVNEMIDLILKIEHPEQAGPSSLSYHLDIKNWDINKEQEFDFPVLTEENTLDPDETEENMPFLMEDLFNKKD